MRRTVRVLALCLPFLCAGCGGEGLARQTAVDPIPAEIDWTRTDPLAFLHLLVEHPGETFSVSTPPPVGWITADHVEALMERIDSREPASVVVSSLSSFVPLEPASTEGREALFLIEGLREGNYPPRLCSVHYFEPDLEEYRVWWAERRQQGY